MDPQPLDGDVLFPNGMNSLSDAWSLPPGSYVWGLNVWNRGGSIRTRPGFRVVYELPDGNLQGFSTFTPRYGNPQLIAVVDGVVNVSSFPYKSNKSLTAANGNAVLSKKSKRCYTVNAVKSVQRNADNSLKLVSPQSVMIFQDGLSAPVSYDGNVTKFRGGANGIPQGTVMAWSGGRLWVAQKDKLIAGDIADPFSSFERSYNTLGGLDFFTMPGPITAMHEAPGMVKPPLVVFTDTTTTAVQSNQAERVAWNSNPDFISSVFPTVGCNAGFSPTVSGGKLWWHSTFGWMNFDSAAEANVSTMVLPESNEMYRSAKNLSSDVTGICGTSYDNVLLSSVPHAGKRNTHTWVYDSAPERVRSKQAAPCWSSVWTGVAPVQWAHVTRHGQTRIFCASKDADGKNRVYEAFVGNRDNGCDFPWAVETRAYTGNTAARKQFRFAELQLRSLLGKVNLKGMWAGGARGPWKETLSTEINAIEGNIVGGEEINFDDQLFGLQAQSRRVATTDIKDSEDAEFSSCNIESGDREVIDTSFMLRIEGSGQCEIKAIRMFMEPWKEYTTGECSEANELTGAVRFDGAASDDVDELQEFTEPFTSTKTAEARYKDTNWTAVGAATVLSSISQADADKRALQLAGQRAEYKLRQITPPYEAQ
jgi:hypothetical protein